MPKPPSSLVPLPAAVDDVLLRAIDPDPEQRWPDVGSFTRALARTAAPVPEPTAPRPVVRVPEPVEQTVPAAAPRRSLLVLVLLCLVVLAATFGASYALTSYLR